MKPPYELFRLGAGVRNMLYDRETRKPAKSAARVISVGGISFGGAGKTPMTIHVANLCLKHAAAGEAVAVLSRGYRRLSRGFHLVSDGKRLLTHVLDAGDEPYMMARNLPQAIVAVDENRVRGASKLMEMFPVKTIILDDGFQHRRIHRDFDLVMVKPGTVINRGKGCFLREGLCSLKRADAVVALDAHEEDVPAIIENLEKYSEAQIFFGRRKPVSLVRLRDGKEISFDELKGKKAAGFCALASPESFVDIVLKLGFKLTQLLSFKDHSRYNTRDQERISRFFVGSGAEILLTSEKDAVKISPILHILPIYYITIRVEMENPALFEKHLFP